MPALRWIWMATSVARHAQTQPALQARRVQANDQSRQVQTMVQTRLCTCYAPADHLQTVKSVVSVCVWIACGSCRLHCCLALGLGGTVLILGRCAISLIGTISTNWNWCPRHYGIFHLRTSVVYSCDVCSCAGLCAQSQSAVRQPTVPRAESESPVRPGPRPAKKRIT